MTTKEKFLKDIKSFMKKHKMSASAFGEQFTGSPKFVFDLEKGRNVGLNTVERIQTKMKIFDGNCKNKGE